MISGTRSSWFQEPESPLSVCAGDEIGAPNLSNIESFGFLLTEPARIHCRGARFHEPGPGIANWFQVSRFGFTNTELQHATKAHLHGLFGQAFLDTRPSTFRAGQFANSAHSEASTQTRNPQTCVNPLQRLVSHLRRFTKPGTPTVGREERKGLPRLLGFVVFGRPALHCETPKIAGTGDHRVADARRCVTALTLSVSLNA